MHDEYPFSADFASQTCSNMNMAQSNTKLQNNNIKVLELPFNF